MGPGPEAGLVLKASSQSRQISVSETTFLTECCSLTHAYVAHLHISDATAAPSYPESDAVLPGGVLEASPGRAVTGTGEPQLYLSPVRPGQKLEPKTVGLRQAAVHPGQSSPGTASGARREGAATWSRLVHIRQVRVVLQRKRLTAWREPVPLGQHGIARCQDVNPNSRKISTNCNNQSFSRSSCCAFLLPSCVEPSNLASVWRNRAVPLGVPQTHDVSTQPRGEH